VFIFFHFSLNKQPLNSQEKLISDSTQIERAVPERWRRLHGANRTTAARHPYLEDLKGRCRTAISKQKF